MHDLTEGLRQLGNDDPDVAYILRVFEEIETVYRNTLEAMGVVSEKSPGIGNSAEVTVAFQPSDSSAYD